MHIKINKNYLTFNQYKVKCAVGKRGIGNKTKEGDLITPKGHYKIKFILYRKDRVKKIQTKFKKIIIKKNMGWCDDPKSKEYNKLIKTPFNYLPFTKLIKSCRKLIHKMINFIQSSHSSNVPAVSPSVAPV